MHHPNVALAYICRITAHLTLNHNTIFNMKTVQDILAVFVGVIVFAAVFWIGSTIGKYDVILQELSPSSVPALYLFFAPLSSWALIIVGSIAAVVAAAIVGSIKPPWVSVAFALIVLLAIAVSSAFVVIHLFSLMSGVLGSGTPP